MSKEQPMYRSSNSLSAQLRNRRGLEGGGTCQRGFRKSVVLSFWLVVVWSGVHVWRTRVWLG